MENQINSKFQIGDLVVDKATHMFQGLEYANRYPFRVVYISEIPETDTHLHTYKYCVEDRGHFLHILDESNLLRHGDVERSIQNCPVCGSSANKRSFIYSSTNRSVSYIECANVDCGFRGPERKTKKEAIEGWNNIARKLK